MGQEANLSRTLANRAERIIKGQQTALKSVFEFYNGYDPMFTWWVTKPYQQLDSTLTKYAGQRIATRSIPGLLLVGGAIAAKTIYDKRKERRSQ